MAESEFSKKLYQLRQEGIGYAFDSYADLPDPYLQLLKQTGLNSSLDELVSLSSQISAKELEKFSKEEKVDSLISSIRTNRGYADVFILLLAELGIKRAQHAIVGYLYGSTDSDRWWAMHFFEKMGYDSDALGAIKHYFGGRDSCIYKSAAMASLLWSRNFAARDLGLKLDLKNKMREAQVHRKPKHKLFFSWFFGDYAPSMGSLLKRKTICRNCCYNPLRKT